MVKLILNQELDRRGVSLRELSRRLDIPRTTLGDMLLRGSPIHVDELAAVAGALDLFAWQVVAAAEWMVNGVPPEGLTRQELVDVSKLFDAAARYQSSQEGKS